MSVLPSVISILNRHSLLEAVKETCLDSITLHGDVLNAGFAELHALSFKDLR
jgi:hypothetical protein